MARPVTDDERYTVLIRYVESFQEDVPSEEELKHIAAFLPTLLKTMQQHNRLEE